MEKNTEPTESATSRAASAIARLLDVAAKKEAQHRKKAAELRVLTSELKAIGASPGQTPEKLAPPITEETFARAIQTLQDGKMNVKTFQINMNFFDTNELSRLRKALEAAGVTNEERQGSVVFISLKEESTS